MQPLRRSLIRLAHSNPELRPHLLPMLNFDVGSTPYERLTKTGRHSVLKTARTYAEYEAEKKGHGKALSQEAWEKHVGPHLKAQEEHLKAAEGTNPTLHHSHKAAAYAHGRSAYIAEHSSAVPKEVLHEAKEATHRAMAHEHAHVGEDDGEDKHLEAAAAHHKAARQHRHAADFKYNEDSTPKDEVDDDEQDEMNNKARGATTKAEKASMEALSHTKARDKTHHEKWPQYAQNIGNHSPPDIK